MHRSFAAVAVLGASITATTATAQPVTITQDHAPACVHQASISKIITFREAGDRAGFGLYLTAAMERGECMLLGEGTPIYILDVQPAARIAKVRLPQTGTILWVIGSAILPSALR
jgi:hypothetical protein